MEIDDIFEEIDKSKENSKEKLKDNPKDKSRTIIQKESLIDEDDFKYLSNKDNRKYVDGLPVYSLEELKIGQGGDTEDCPFDCDCCY